MARRRIPLADLVARGPVLSRQQARSFEAALPSGRPGPALAEGPPILPLTVFGAAYDLDLVVVDEHPAWDMHELARLETPDGPVWMAKDSRAADLVQTLVADHPGLEGALPEVPLERRRGAVEVEEGPGRWTLRYPNALGSTTRIALTCGPLRPQRWRNSSTMGHSSDVVLAVLDLSHRALARAEVEIDGVGVPVRRILGLVPFAVALRQVQAGFASGAWTQVGLRTRHGAVEQGWSQQETALGVDLVQEHPWGRLVFSYRREGAALELHRARVEPFGRADPACEAWFQPCLPDLRAAGPGVFEGRFRLDVNGQVGHGTGRVVVRTSEAGAEVELRPTAPRWLADRWMRVELRRGAGEVSSVARIVRP